MKRSEELLSRLFAPKEPPFLKSEYSEFAAVVKDALAPLSSQELADFFVKVSLLRSGLDFLYEQRWIERKRTGAYPSARFVDKFLKEELAPLYFLREVLREASLAGAEHFKVKAEIAEAACRTEASSRVSSAQKQFCIHALSLISELFEFESRLEREKSAKGEYLGLRLYRTFDGLDEIFNLNYSLGEGAVPKSPSDERLYEGGGVSVQSGYSTVLLALRELNPALGARFVDLGSGYGRVGLVVGLLRPDMYFKGYEYVKERVDVARACTENLNLQSRVQFHAQDLAQKDFRIPDAEVYYLYDPFNEDTYRHVIAQLREMGRRQKIAVATKGNARSWMTRMAQDEGWLAPQEFDHGNFCVFRSR